jgi:hypothetical protein
VIRAYYTAEDAERDHAVVLRMVPGAAGIDLPEVDRAATEESRRRRRSRPEHGTAGAAEGER